ncbi:MAG: hypothetical protein WBD50_06545 [Candidatus Rhabdochlamydia sp.]
MKSFFLISIFSFSFLYSHLKTSHEDLVCRAAIDIGSGKIGILVAEVNIKTNKIVRVLFSDIAKLPLRLSLEKTGAFNEEIQKNLFDILQEFKKKASAYYPQSYFAIATEAFRLSKNGKEVADKIHEEFEIPVAIISQKEEGALGFLTAVNTAKIDPENTIVYDQGGGSFQVTYKEGDSYITYEGKVGKVVSKLKLLEIQNKDPAASFSPNPVSITEAMQGVKWVQDQIADIPETLLQKIKIDSFRVKGIGAHPQVLLTKQATYDIHHVSSHLEKMVDLTDASIISTYPSISSDFHTTALVELILTYSVMDQFGIQTIDYVPTLGGNTSGLLISQKYWE